MPWMFAVRLTMCWPLKRSISPGIVPSFKLRHIRQLAYLGWPSGMTGISPTLSTLCIRFCGIST